MKAQVTSQRKDNRKTAEKEGRSQRYTPYFSILLRSSDAIICSLVYLTQQTFIECKQIIYYFVSFPFTNKTFFDKKKLLFSFG